MGLKKEDAMSLTSNFLKRLDDKRVERGRAIIAAEKARAALPVCPKCMGYGAFYSICDCDDGKDRSSSSGA